jgi:heterodisulfide reductase subunit C
MRRALGELPAERGLNNCIDCKTCQAACVRGVSIARRLDELKSIFA